MVALDTSLDKGWWWFQTVVTYHPYTWGEMESNFTNIFHFKGVETTKTHIAYSDHYDAFDSLREGMSDAVAALKTTDFLLAQLDNLSRSPGNSFHLSFSPYIPSHSTRLSNLSQRSKGRVCALRFQSPLRSLLEDCLGAACLHTQLVLGRRGDGCFR